MIRIPIQYDATFSDAIDVALDFAMEHMYTALPGRIVSYDASTQTASVKSILGLVRHENDGKRVVDDIPEISDVPVQYPRSGSYGMTFELNAGDTGMIMFSQVALEKWLSSGNGGDPGNAARFSLAGAFFVPGIFSDAKALGDLAASTGLRIGRDGGLQMSIDPSSLKLGAGTEAVIKGDTFLITLNILLTSLNAFLGTLAPAAVTDSFAARDALVSAISAFTGQSTMMKSLTVKTE